MGFIEKNWEFIALFVGGIGTLWNFISEKWKDKLKRPFANEKEKIELKTDNLEFMEKWQDFQNKQIDDVLRRYDEFKIESAKQLTECKELISKMQLITDDLKERVNIEREFLKKHRAHIKYLEQLLEINKINYNKMTE